jgi:hypothetical protein
MFRVLSAAKEHGGKIKTDNRAHADQFGITLSKKQGLISPPPSNSMNVALPISFAQLDPGGDQFPERSLHVLAADNGGPIDRRAAPRLPFGNYRL